MREVDRRTALESARAALRAHGISDADADLVADVLVSADARGKHSHGLLRLPRFVRGIEHGNVDPDGDVELVRQRGAVVTLSGGSRLGPVAAVEATVEAADRAEEFGAGVVGVNDTNHLGMLGYYTDELRREGYVGVAVTNGEPAMAPYGGSEPILGTNPIAVGLPTDPPFNLDMAMSAIARGDILHRLKRDEPLPDGVALDTDGQPTTDPEAALEGSIRPIAGPKGSGLAVAVELLAGGFVGASMGREVTGTYHTEMPCTNGDLFLAVDPEALGGEAVLDRANAFLRRLKESPRAAGFDEIRIPGERSVERDEVAGTIEVEPDLWAEIQQLAG
jgi:L-2-hydroxycarboxylate dehydrogenase (NAD+)